MVKHITAEKLREVLHYDPETGIFTWLVTRGKMNAGDRAGTEQKGYRSIKIFGRLYREARLAWFYVHGEWPKIAEHEDGDGLNNRIRNIRDSTQAQNVRNTKKKTNNKSGFKGVCFRKDIQKWGASIQTDGKQKHLGYFETPEDAHEFYCLAADMLHGEFSNHGIHKCAPANI
jgi:hypothetical protein